jgi:hypothetical protein
MYYLINILVKTVLIASCKKALTFERVHASTDADARRIDEWEACSFLLKVRGTSTTVL